MNRILQKKTVTRISTFFKKVWQENLVASLILVVCTIISLTIANLPFSFAEMYRAFWKLDIAYLSSIHLPNTPSKIINDVLMPLFFFVVGYEIRHEIFSKNGSLNTKAKFMLPLVAASGGVLVPAIIYVLFNTGSPTLSGWAIPTATDIAFSVAAIGMAGKSIPRNAKILLMALAVFDDLIAVIIISLCYGGTIEANFFVMAMGIAVAVFFINRRLKMTKWVQLLIFILYVLLWQAVHLSNIHPTIVGIIIVFLMKEKTAKYAFDQLGDLVAFGVVPLFVLANTSIPIDMRAIFDLWSPVALGIIGGLLIGKPLGIYLLIRICTYLKIASLPTQVNYMHIIGIGMIAGIGFTMSIFVSQLSFQEEYFTNIAKISIIIASFLSAAFGTVFMKMVVSKRRTTDV